MMQRTPYSFSILRYIHDITSEEFINVGIVLIANDRSFVFSKINTNYGRAKKIFPTLNAENFKKRLKSIQSLADGIAIRDQHSLQFTSENPLPGLLQHVLAKDDSALQWSAIKSGLSKDLSETVSALYTRYIVKFEKTVVDSKKKDEDIWREFKGELEKRHLIKFLTPTTISSSDDSVSFDHAWKNGIWHCLEPISFDLSSASSIKEKAHKWLGQISSVAEGADEEFAVYFLAGRPVETDLYEAYKQALGILKKSNKVQVFEENDAEEFSQSFENKVKRHQLEDQI